MGDASSVPQQDSAAEMQPKAQGSLRDKELFSVTLYTDPTMQGRYCMAINEQSAVIPHLTSPNNQQVCFQHVSLDFFGVKTTYGLTQHH